MASFNRTAELLQFLERKLSAADYEEAERQISQLGGEAEDQNGLPRPGGAMDRRHSFAMDSRHPGRIVADRDMAILECSTVLPRENLIACDSATAVFRTALDHLGVRHSGVHESALPEIFRGVRAQSRGGSRAPSGRQPTAAESKSFSERFPDAARIRGV